MEAHVSWFAVCAFCAVLIVLSSHIRCNFGSHIDLMSDDARYERGKSKLMELQSQRTRYGPCWTAALDSLETGCRQLSEDVQHELALKFAGCFLLKTGRQVLSCDDVDKTECTRQMSPEAFNVYTEFFTHTQSICFYLQASEWQITTEETVNRLTDTSANVVHKLQSAEDIQHELLRKQNDSIRIQQHLLEGGEALQQTLEESKSDVQAMMIEFQNAATEQAKLKKLIFEVFDRVQSLQSIVLGEFAGFYSLIFYALAIVIAYLLTSTPRTSGARFWLFLILTLNVAMEWMLAKWYDVAGQLDPVTGHPLDENTLVYTQMRACRKCFTALAVGVWCWMAYRYRDVNEMNNQILLQVKQQNAEIKALLQTSASPVRPSSYAFDLTDAAASNQQMKLDAETSTGYNSLGEISDNDGLGQYRQTSGTVADEPAAVNAQQNAPAVDCQSTAVPNHQDDSVKIPVRRRRTAATHGDLSPSQHSPVSTSVVSHYNLRSRLSSPTTEAETTASDLGAEVKRVIGISARNRVKVLRMIQRPNSISSDED